MSQPTLIHVNQHVIRANQRHGRIPQPPIAVKRGTETRYAYRVEILGPSETIYAPQDPLPCGARLWIQTSAEVLLDGRPYDEAPRLVSVPSESDFGQLGLVGF